MEQTNCKFEHAGQPCALLESAHELSFTTFSMDMGTSAFINWQQKALTHCSLICASHNKAAFTFTAHALQLILIVYRELYLLLDL